MYPILLKYQLCYGHFWNQTGPTIYDYKILKIKLVFYESFFSLASVLQRQLLEAIGLQLIGFTKSLPGFGIWI